MNFRSSHLSLAVLLLACASLQVRAQAVAVWSDWETLHPEGEEFTVSMPKNYTSEAGKFPYHKMELTGRLYLASQNAGPVVAVASFSGIKSAPALYTDFQRFNSYVDAFKEWFPAKVRGKDAIAKLVLLGNKTFNGHAGREYKLTIGDLTGVAQAYATKKRFYVIVSLNTKTDAALQEKFISSFMLPERTGDEKKQVTAENNAAQEAQPTTAEAEPNLDQKRNENNPQANSNAKPRSNDENASGGTDATKNPGSNPNQADSSQPKQKRAPISGGVLNGKAIYLPPPDMPPGEASGVVMVQVLIDEQGGVVEARAVSGPSHLQASAVNAARLARFSPTLLMGEPVRVSGTLSYNFVKSN